MNKPLEYALKLLSKKDYTEAELRQKFVRREFSPEESEAALLFLLDKKYIDDERYAKQYLASHPSRGSIRLKFELIKRGVDSHIIAEVLATDENQSLKAREVAVSWLEKKRSSYEDRYKLKQHLVAKLSRQGFSYEVIVAAIEDLI